MLVLGRNKGERVRLLVGETVIWVVLIDAGHGYAQLGFVAPREVEINREERLPLWKAQERSKA